MISLQKASIIAQLHFIISKALLLNDRFSTLRVRLTMIYSRAT